MPLLNINDPAILGFLKENYEKENRVRLTWITKHSAKVKEAAILRRPPTNYFETDVLVNTFQEGMATITRDHYNSGRNRRTVAIRDGTIQGLKQIRYGHSIVDVGLGDPKDDPRLLLPETDLKKVPILMRPVDPKVARIVYKPKPEFGRAAYLEKRAKMRPETKYYYAECDSWKYGWRLGDTALKSRPSHGRCWHLTKTMISRGRIGPDPPHYKSSEAPSTKCNT